MEKLFKKSVENFKKHPAYKPEDLEVKNEEELKAAKKAAGVTTHKKAIERMQIDEMGEETREIIALFSDVFGHNMNFGEEMQYTGIEEIEGTEYSIEILLSDVGRGTDYISYPIKDTSKDKFETLPPLTGAVGTSVEAELSPEDLVHEFQRIIKERDELIKSGYEVSRCQDPGDKGIYELEFSKIVNDLDDLKNNLKKLKDILANKE